MTLSARIATAIRHSWQGKGCLSTALLPLSWLYRGAAALNKKLYEDGHKASEHAGAFTVVVGNVIAGGAGKTPVTIGLVQALQARGIAVGVVSRGYGRSQGADCLEVQHDSLAADVGDEPLLIHRKTHAPVFVAAKRLTAAQALLAHYPRTQIIVSDDGLQHWALERDYEVCVFNESGLMNARLLPAGPLREAWPRPVDAVLYQVRPDMATEGEGAKTTAPSNAAYAPMRAWPLQRRLAPLACNAQGQTLALAQLSKTAAPESAVPHAACEKVAPDTVIALAGIANPQAFFSMLAQQGIALDQALPLPDHANTEALAALIEPAIAASATGKAVVLCTEKDAVKLWDLLPSAYAVALESPLPEPFIDDLLARFAQYTPEEPGQAPPPETDEPAPASDSGNVRIKIRL